MSSSMSLSSASLLSVTVDVSTVTSSLSWVELTSVSSWVKSPKVVSPSGRTVETDEDGPKVSSEIGSVVRAVTSMLVSVKLRFKSILSAVVYKAELSKESSKASKSFRVDSAKGKVWRVELGEISDALLFKCNRLHGALNSGDKSSASCLFKVEVDLGSNLLPEGPVVPKGPGVPEGPVVPEGPRVPEGPVVPEGPGEMPVGSKTLDVMSAGLG